MLFSSVLLSASVPSPFVSISPSWFTFGLALVILFALTRPLTVKDFENRRLPVNAVAQVGFTLFYCLAFVVLVLMVHYARPLLSSFFAAVGAIDFATRTLQPKSDSTGAFAPLFAMSILGWSQSLSLLREVERTILVYVYSARYQHKDVVALGYHFLNCPLNPPPGERAKNRQVLERLNVVLTDSDTSKLDLRVIGDWRKVETLLRHLKTWRAEGKLSLTPDEVLLLDKVETAHERKTALALNIVRMLDHLAKGGGPNATFQQVTNLLEATQKGDREALARAEVMAAEALATQSPPTMPDADPAAAAIPEAGAQPELRMTSVQLKQFLGQIESYFLQEYRILLAQTGDLAAKGIIHAGDCAESRLEQMKLVGFEGLGQLLPIRFDRILMVFLVAFGISLGLFAFRATVMHWSGERAPMPAQQSIMMFATISLTIALATIIGAFVGSTRELAQAQRTPWGSYALAGLFAVSLFLLVHAARVSLGGPSVQAQTTQASQVTSPPATGAAAPVTSPKAAALNSIGSTSQAPPAIAEPGTRQSPLVRPPSLHRTLPWAIIPFMMTVAICFFARLERWPGAGQPANRSVERALDGVALGLVMVAAVVVVNRAVFPILEAYPSLGIARPPHFAAAWKTSWLPLQMVLTQFGTGFLIGALVLRDVRRAAHARVVIAAPTQPKPAPSTVVKSVPPFHDAISTA